MAKRPLSPDERRMIGWLAAVMASYDSADRIIPSVCSLSHQRRWQTSGCRDECAKKACTENAELALAAPPIATAPLFVRIHEPCCRR